MSSRNYHSLSAKFIAQLAFVAATGSATSATMLVSSNLGSVVLNRVHQSSLHITQLSAQDYVNRGIARLLLNDIKGANDNFTKAIKLQPSNANAYALRAIAKYGNDKQGASVDINKAIALDPNNSNVQLFNMLEQGRDIQYASEKALVDINKAIALDPNNFLAYTLRAQTKYFLPDYQGALADYNKAIALVPDIAGAYYWRAYLKQEKLNDFQGALADYNKAIALDPNIAKCYAERASLKSKFKDYRGALADYDKAISIESNIIYYMSRASLKSKLKDYRGVIADYDKLIALRPNDSHAYYWRGILKYEKLKNRSGGIADLRQAARLEGNSSNNSLKKLREWGVSK